MEKQVDRGLGFRDHWGNIWAILRLYWDNGKRRSKILFRVQGGLQEAK